MRMAEIELNRPIAIKTSMVVLCNGTPATIGRDAVGALGIDVAAKGREAQDARPDQGTDDHDRQRARAGDR